MSTLQKFVSDVVLGKVGSSDLGYTTEEITVTYAAGMDVGALVTSAGAWVAAAGYATIYGVIVDMKAKNLDGGLTAGETFPWVVAVRGTTFKGDKLKYSDATIDANGIAVLEGKGNKVQ